MSNSKTFRTAVCILVVSVVIFSGCLRRRGPASGPIDLLFYGLDNSEVFETIIAEYRSAHPQIRIRYKKFNDAADFENLLINEIAEGEGPDIFYLRNTWLPRHRKKMVPLKSKTFTTNIFGDTFVNVTKEDFIQPDPSDGVEKIFALPLYVDTLALYYNKKDFEQKLPERGKPASTWDQFKQDAAKLREEQDGQLVQGAIALGRSDNIKKGVDALYHFFLQGGVSLYDRDMKKVSFAASGQRVFEDFLSFAKAKEKHYSWSAELMPATTALGEVEAFIAGKVSSILGYSDLYFRLENEIKNVKTRYSSVIAMKDIGVTTSPQRTSDESQFKVFADYYGVGVSRNSKNSVAAWNFIQFLTSKEQAKLYHQKTKRPAARRDLIADQKKDSALQVFASQVGYAGSYRIYSDTRFEEALSKAITEAHAGLSIGGPLTAAETKLNEVLKIESPEGLYPTKKIQKKKK